jgi:hypothetical protein
VLKGLGDLKNLLGQARDVQKHLKEFQAKAKTLRVSATVGAGMVTVVASGDQKIIDIKINRELFDPRDVDMLEELILSGVNEALSKSKDKIAEEMKNYSKKMNLPDLEAHLKDTFDLKP